MKLNEKLTPYNKKTGHSYTLGAFPTIELLQSQPQHAQKVLIHSDLNSDHQMEVISNLCNQYSIPLEKNNRLVEKLRMKDNCLVIGIFYKYVSTLIRDENHVVLVNPSDMGNMGTIIRTCIGFGVKNLAIIDPAVDLFHPKVVRASMGSIFHLNFSHYSSFEQYYNKYANRTLYPFMSNGKTELRRLKKEKNQVFSAIFGNESSGLDDSFLNMGSSVFIKHSNNIDSLNLSLAVGIGLYELMK